MIKSNIDDVFVELKKKKLSLHERTNLWQIMESQMNMLNLNHKNGYWNFVTRRLLVSSSAAVLVTILAFGGIYKVFQLRSSTVIPTHPNQTVSANTKILTTLPGAIIQYNDSLTKWNGLPVAPYQPPVYQSTGKPVIDNWQITGASSMPLNPEFQSLLKVPRTIKQELSTSRAISGFPIREPSTINGWEHVFSQGVEFPIRHILNGKFTGYTHTQTYYYDIFRNSSGQKIAVTQTMDPNISREIALLREKNPPYWVLASNPKVEYHVGAHIINGNPGDLSILFVDTKDSMKQLITYHLEKDNVVTVLTVDGVVPAVDLLSFSKIYLSSPN